MFGAGIENTTVVRSWQILFSEHFKTRLNTWMARSAANECIYNMNALTFLQNLKEQFLHFLSCMGFKLVSQLVKLGKTGETYTLVMKILCGQGDMQSLSLISDLASITNPSFLGRLVTRIWIMKEILFRIRRIAGDLAVMCRASGRRKCWLSYLGFPSLRFQFTEARKM